jgi:hypothetical protein
MFERSYVRNVDLLFNLTGSDLTSLVNSVNDGNPSNDRIKLTKYDLNGNNPTNVPLANVLSAIDHAIEFDFGVNGIGGNRNSTAGDGYYKIDVDLNGDGTFDVDRRCYRLLGDVNGDRGVDNSDINAIAGAISSGQTSGPVLELDANGDVIINVVDMILATRSKGRKLASGLRIDG